MSTSNERNENHGDLTFEALQSANFQHYDQSNGDGSKKHFSIDLSLELERQLEMDSVPPTPLDADSQQKAQQLPQRDDLDPHVLANIIMQLRHTMADVSKERDDLRHMLLVAQSKEAGLQDALQESTDKSQALEDELEQARQKIRDDEDAINMLRTKVEESRRGLMRLQTENRRQSIQPIDLSRAGIPNFGSPPSSKRASFTPLTGSMQPRPNGHRRISSVSDSGGNQILPNAPSGSPPSQYVTLSDTASLHPSTNPANRRSSGIFGRASPPRLDLQQHDPLAAEVDSLRRDLIKVKHELEETKHDLSESNEAREASETCVRALREFIAENNIGAGNTVASAIKLPPPPTMTTGEEADTSKPLPAAGGWGFKLWKESTAAKTHTPSPSVSSVQSPEMPAATGGAPLSRKFTGFFSSRGSISSVQSIPPSAPMSATNTNASHDPYRDSIQSFSDASSIAEPVSPTSEFHGNIMVRDVTNISDLGSALVSPDLVKDNVGLGEEQPRTKVVLG